MALPRKRAGFAQGLYAYALAQKERLGTIRELHDGRAYVYCKNGGVALAAGAVCASAITGGMNEQTVTVAHPPGTKQVIMTDSGGATAANALAEGSLVVTAGSGIGEVYPIVGNSAATAGATFTITLGEGLRTIWSISTTDITAYVNRYNGVVVNPVDGQQIPACVPQIIVPVSNYFWGQIEGHGAMLIDAPAASGEELDEKILSPSLNTAGYAYTDGTPDAAAILAGYRHVLGYLIDEADITNTEARLCQIRIGK